MRDALLTVDEVAEALRIKSKTVRKWIYLGKIRVVKLGRAVRIPQRAVQSLIRAGTKDVRKK